MVLNNIKALRSAIVYCIPRITIMRDDALGDSGRFLVGDEVFESCCNMLRLLKYALDSAPPRNCDVGTPEEQTERYKRFCATHYRANDIDAQCDACPCTSERWDCELEWANMPYEATETKEGGSNGSK